MLQFNLNTDLKIVDREIGDIVQYSEEVVYIYTSFYSTNDVISFNLIRPDGRQIPEVYFTFIEESSPGQFLWEARILPYHTMYIPGDETRGRIILNFTLKNIVNGVIQYIKSSPIINIKVQRSTEPVPEDIESHLTDDIINRLQNLETGTATGDHDELTWESRTKPNQHVIDSIVGLKEEIGVYVGYDEPETGERTWFKSVTGTDPINEWNTLVSSPLIQLGQIFTFPTLPTLYPIRIKITGSVYGEQLMQTFYNEVSNSISGEVILYVDEDETSSEAVRFTLLIENDSIEVIEFQNIGASSIASFAAISIEVYN